MDYQARREKARVLRRIKADALLVSSGTNVTYLTGFTGDDSLLLLRRDGETMITDGRYTTQLGEECPGLDLHVRRPGVPLVQAIVRVLKMSHLASLVIESDAMTVATLETIGEKLPKLDILSASGLVEQFRLIKDKEEIAEIRQAIEYAEKAFEALRAYLRPDHTEKQVADELDHQLRLFGARGSSFPPIVAVGPQAALPHATPGERRLNEGEMLLLDWGASGRLYKSDLTRVLIIGKISPKLRRIYEVVLRAQKQAIRAIRPGVSAEDVDRAARGVIAQAGLGRRFNHGLGHGLGLEVHEAPRLAAKQELLLKPGMVVTVEPGVYIPGWGGVRIEDDVLVTRRGHEVLTSVPKRLDDAVIG